MIIIIRDDEDECSCPVDLQVTFYRGMKPVLVRTISEDVTEADVDEHFRDAERVGARHMIVSCPACGLVYSTSYRRGWG